MSEEKRSEIIHEALNFLDDEMIEDVEKLRGFVQKQELEHSSNDENQVISMKIVTKKRISWRKWTAIAAGICVLIMGTWIYENYVNPANDLVVQTESAPENSVPKNPEADEFSGLFATELWKDYEKVEDTVDAFRQESEEECDSISETPLYEMISGNGVNSESLKRGISIPAMEVNLAKEDEFAGDMLGFFIHEGRCYVQYNYVENGAEFVGECVGTVNGLIDEWTEEDGYVDGAGTFEGKIYEVEGINPEFMLCTTWDDGIVETFINNNGITLGKGSDLVDDRLHLRETFVSVAFQTDYEYSHTQKEPIPLSDETLELFAKFLDSFAENDFAYAEGKSYYPFGGDEDNSHIYHLYFTTENGLVVRFSLMGEGYVCFPWLNGVCVQIDQEIYDAVVDILRNN